MVPTVVIIVPALASLVFGFSPQYHASKVILKALHTACPSWGCTIAQALPPIHMVSNYVHYLYLCVTKDTT